MPSDLKCIACQAPIDPANVDAERDLATCGRCGRLMDLRKVRAASAPAPRPSGPRTRPTMELPTGMSVETGAGVVIRRRWLRSKHWFLLFLFGPPAAYVAYLWTTIDASVWLVLGTLFVVSWNYNLVVAFVNSTVVSVDASRVVVRHGPLPSPFARGTSIAKSDIAQLYAAKYGALFAVEAKLKSGKTQRLVWPLVAAEQALFIEQQVERALGLVDVAVAGELGDDVEAAVIAGKSPPGARSGITLSLGIPILIVSTLALFFIMIDVEVSGRLQASGALGSWSFEPDDCNSGQREGFGGVILMASKQPGRVVRIVKDPVRGNLVVLAGPGSPNHVLASDGCSRFEVNVERTNTNINDIWAMDGALSVECTGLSGSVKFEGCH
jgi:hypothetical protein